MFTEEQEKNSKLQIADVDDQISMDLIQKAPPLPQSKAEGLKLKKGEDVLTAIHKKNATIQMEAAEKMGLGRTSYQLIKVK